MTIPPFNKVLESLIFMMIEHDIYRQLNLTERIRYRFYKSIIKTLAFLPLNWLYLIGAPLRFVLHKLIRYRVKVVRHNLELVFPELTRKNRIKIENDYYKYLVDVAMETIKLAHISDREIKQRVKVEGVELINEAIKNGRSVVLMLGHFGNWEWVTATTLYMDRSAILCEIYHPLMDKAFDYVMLKLRGRFGTENISMSKSIRHLLNIHRSGGKFVCGFIADQRPFSHELKNWTEFCGHQTAYTVGGEVIGKKIGAEFIYANIVPVNRGYYKIIFSKLEPIKDEQPYPYTRAFLRELEKSIRSNPPYWLWSHNRWKRKRNVTD